MGSFRGERGGIAVCVCRGVCTGGSVRKCARHGFRGFPELFVLPHSASGHQDGRAGAPRHLSAAGAGMRYW